MEVKEAIALRRSVRNYKSELPSRELLTEVLEAGRQAPTAVNRQPMRFVCVTNAEMLAKIQTTYHRDWFKTAPAVIVIIAKHDESWHRKIDGKDHADIDAAIAVDHMTLRATDLGLGTCWVCNFEPEAVREILSLKAEEEAVALLPIGYDAEPDADVKRVRKPAETMWEII